MDSSSETTKPNVSSVIDLATKSAEIVKRHWQLFAFVNLLGILSALSVWFYQPEITESSATDPNTLVNQVVFGRDLGVSLGAAAIVIAVVALIHLFFTVLTHVAEVRVTNKEPVSINDVINQSITQFFPLLGLLIISGFIIFIGLILLIVPGIFAIIRLVYAPYFIIDQKLGIIDSIKASNKLSAQNTFDTIAALAFSVLIYFALSFVGIIPFIGPIIALVGGALFSLIIVLRYRELQGGSTTPTHNPDSPIHQS